MYIHVYDSWRKVEVSSLFFYFLGDGIRRSLFEQINGVVYGPRREGERPRNEIRNLMVERIVWWLEEEEERRRTPDLLDNSSRMESASPSNRKRTII